MERTDIFSDDFVTMESGLNDDIQMTVASGANVVVLSQPEEIVTMETGFHCKQETQEEIVWDSNTFHTEFHHEEIARNDTTSTNTGLLNR